MVIIIPTLRIICDLCGDDLKCTEKGNDGYAYHCPKCNVRVHMMGGWASFRPTERNAP